MATNLKTQLFSVDTLHVQVPAEIKSETINEALRDYSVSSEYQGVDKFDGGLKITRLDVESINESVPEDIALREFFRDVAEVLGDADEVYFHR